ncbi:hypothetical protein GOBAR_DD00423 [Gossypium barbadense]|nr:hypothetical protein GOBAR_DD00423 [Gossypium barbadense]
MQKGRKFDLKNKETDKDLSKIFIFNFYLCYLRRRAKNLGKRLFTGKVWEEKKDESVEEEKLDAMESETEEKGRGGKEN